ncbi:septum formation initiator family protein [Thermosulfurimonas marina]|uniref:Septum formation initiator family protein n=1 Tax=Thermosulfurimonas marina TaxID=2047767 RepID=A0A6H1WU53_9BACT|nr:septum formation initiator family protein [Thermosulfurimonas marina]QJA06679.1 septum formation initiator family protein [Thermosulfurimonas marina]
MSPRGAGVYIPPGAGTASRKKKKTSSPRRRWGIGIGLFWLVGVGFLGATNWLYQRETSLLARLEAENQRLAARIEALQKHPELYEEIARKKYGYVKKNERLIIFGKGRAP